MKWYGLALWWGAARWLSHIGIIKFLEETDIQINEIAGTSMWAIIASCFAIWMTSKDIVDALTSINFLKLIDLNLKQGIVSWENVYKELEKIFGSTLIENTNIPLKIVATNIESWEKEVFTNGKIIDALRASISLPIIFKTVELNKKIFVDGWLKENLPILELKSKEIIAVSVIRWKESKIKTHKKLWNFEFKTWFWEFNYQILRNTIALIMKTNEDFSLEIWQKQWKIITLLKPNTAKYEYYDFNKYQALIEVGYKEAQSKLWTTTK